MELWGEDALLQSPGARRALIQERDAYMARTIWAAASGIALEMAAARQCFCHVLLIEGRADNMAHTAQAVAYTGLPMLIQACQHHQHTFWTTIKGAGSGDSQCQRVALQWQRPLVVERDSTGLLRRLQRWWPL